MPGIVRKPIPDESGKKIESNPSHIPVETGNLEENHYPGTKFPKDGKNYEFDGETPDMIIEDDPNIKKKKERKPREPKIIKESEPLFKIEPEIQLLKAEIKNINDHNININGNFDSMIKCINEIDKRLELVESQIIKQTDFQIPVPIEIFEQAWDSIYHSNKKRYETAANGKPATGMLGNLNVVKTVCEFLIKLVKK